MTLGHLANVVAAGLGFLAGAIALFAARVDVPHSFTVYVDTMQSSFDGSIGAYPQSHDLDKLGPALKKQGTITLAAAICAILAGVSAMIGAILSP